MFEVRPEFENHLLSERGLLRSTEIRAAYSALLGIIERHVPKSRELSLALTHLQDSATWAVSGLINNPENKL